MQLPTLIGASSVPFDRVPYGLPWLGLQAN